MTYPRVPFDVAAYVARVRGDDRCFVCRVVAGDDDHVLVHRDDVCIAFSATRCRPRGSTSMSLGSHEGNAHVHWQVAPLPPGVPYEEQQYPSLMQKHDIPPADQAAIVARIAARISLHGSPPN